MGSRIQRCEAVVRPRLAVFLAQDGVLGEAFADSPAEDPFRLPIGHGDGRGVGLELHFEPGGLEVSKRRASRFASDLGREVEQSCQIPVVGHSSPPGAIMLQ